MERFPTFLRTIPSDAMVPQGVISVMKEFGWENIGVITQQEDAFTSVCEYIHKCLYFSLLEHATIHRKVELKYHRFLYLDIQCLLTTCLS